MPRLDFSNANIQVIVINSTTEAEFNIDNFVDDFDIGTPDIDLGQILTWSGGFTVAYTTKAIRDGLQESDFSPRSRPELWRPDRKVIFRFTSSGGTVHDIPLRIENYSYAPSDAATPAIGEANLYTLLDAVNKDRPAQDAGFNVGGAGNAIAGVIQHLITLSFGGGVLDSGNVPGPADVAGIWGAIDDKVSTRNPIREAAALAQTSWRWMTLRHSDEGASFISGNPWEHPVLFARPDNGFRIEPGDNPGEWFSEAIVAGSYQKSGPPDEDCGEDGVVQEQDSKGRPKIIRTTSTATFAEVYKNGGTSQNLTTAQRKTILFQYGDSELGDNLVSLWNQVSGGMSVPNPLDVQTYIPEIQQDLNNSQRVGTVTILERPEGRIFKQLGVAQTLRVYEVEIESDRRKTNLKPWGTIYKPAGTVFTLLPAPDERIDTGYASRPTFQPQLSDPNDPNSKQCLEARVKPEDPLPAPQFKMETVPVRGNCGINPEGWNPVLKLPNIWNAGFVPSQAHASYLACRLAEKLARESDPWEITLPIPDEWIEAGCPGYFRAHLGDAHYECTAVRVIREGGLDFMQFAANYIGAATAIPAPTAPAPFIPTYDAMTGAQPLAATANVGAISGLAGALNLGPNGQALTGVAGANTITFKVTATGGNP